MRFDTKNTDRPRGGAHARTPARYLPTTDQLENELSRQKRKRNSGRVFRGLLVGLIAVAAAAVLSATIFMPVLQIYGTSMTPTLNQGEIVVTVKSGFEQGDVIAFYYNNKIIVKRAMAFEGDVVDIDKDGTVYINDVRLNEPYLAERSLGECDIKLPYQVPADKIFVIGDKRDVSIDSRSTAMGCIPESDVVGKIVFRVWPFNRSGAVH